MSLFKPVRQLFVIVIEPVISHLFFRSTSTIKCIVCNSEHLCSIGLEFLPPRCMIFHPCILISVSKFV
nr:MAG TPA: hypothetical protein [Caudoviricetes sp.]